VWPGEDVEFFSRVSASELEGGEDTWSCRGANAKEESHERHRLVTGGSSCERVFEEET
jgi:hypothetical protein